MPDLKFEAISAEAVAFNATPTISFKLRVDGPEGYQIKGVSLEAQVRIDAQLRRYNDAEKENLFEIFDEPSRWGQTVRSLLWAMASVNVPSFTDTTTVDLPVPCTWDFNVLSAKYFHGLEEGSAPITLLFSGTVFYYGDEGQLQIERIPWSKEATFQLPVSTWKDMMQFYYPNTSWLALHVDTFNALLRYKNEQRIPTFEQVIESLIKQESRP